MNTTSDTVTGFGYDVQQGWAVLASDGEAHPCADATILHWCQVAAAHLTPVQVILDIDPFKTITYVSLDFTKGASS